MASIKDKITAQNSQVIEENTTSSIKEPLKQQNETQKQPIKQPKQASPGPQKSVEPQRVNQVEQISITQPQMLNIKNKIKNNNQEVVDFNNQTDKLKPFRTGQDVFNAVNKGQLGNDDLSFLKQNDPQLYQDFLSVDTTDSKLSVVNSFFEPSNLTATEQVATSFLKSFQQSQQQFLQTYLDGQEDFNRQELYNSIVNTEESKKLGEEVTSIEREIDEIDMLLKQTEDDVRSQMGGNATESYIQAVTAKRQRELLFKKESLVDDYKKARGDLTSVQQAAQREFEFAIQDRIEQQNMEKERFLTLYNMSQEQFSQQWSIIERQLEKEERGYWANKDFADRVQLAQIEEGMRREAMQFDYEWSRKNADKPDPMVIKNGDFTYLYDTDSGEVIQTFGQGAVDINAYSAGGYINQLGTVTAYGSDIWKHGLDIAGQEGQLVPTAFGGEVVKVVTDKTSRDGSGFGNYVQVKLDDGSTVQYSHLGVVSVQKGQRVAPGQSVGTMSNTGTTIGATGVHVDITMKKPGGGYYTPQEVERLHNAQSSVAMNVDSMIAGVSPVVNRVAGEKRDGFLSSIEYALKSGDKNLVEKNLTSAYMSGLTADGKKKFEMRQRLVFQLKDLKGAMLQYEENGGDFNIFTGTEQQILDRIGETNDPALKQLQIRIKDLVDQVARDRTGAALTESEERFYDRLLPGIDKQMEVNLSIIDGLIDSQSLQDKALKFSMASELTDSMVEYLYGDDPDFLEELGITIEEEPEFTQNDIMMDLAQFDYSLTQLTAGIPKNPSFVR